MKKTDTDWALAERLYSTTSMTNAAIARQVGCRPQALSNQITRGKWIKATEEVVSLRTRAAVKTHGFSEDKVRQEKRQLLQTLAEQEIERGVQAAVDVNIQIIAEHRELALRARNGINTLLRELIHDTEHIDEILDDIEIDCTRTRDASDPDGPSDEDSDIDFKRRARMMNAVSLGTRASAARSLATALKIIVETERVAFGIDDNTGKEKPQDTLRSLMDEIDGKTIGLPSTMKRLK